jgi:hypothetical protein
MINPTAQCASAWDGSAKTILTEFGMKIGAANAGLGCRANASAASNSRTLKGMPRPTRWSASQVFEKVGSRSTC